MSLGEKLKDLRLKEQRTMQAQSELCGVKINSVFRWEHDMTVPKEEVLKKIAKLHGVPLAWLTQDCDAKDSVRQDDIDQQFLSMFDKLSDNQKHRLLGYTERIYIEGPNSIK